MLNNNKYLIISDLPNYKIYFANKIMPSSGFSYTPKWRIVSDSTR